MSKINRLLLALTFLLLTIFIAACSESSSGNANGNQDNDSDNNNDEQEEITLRWAYQWGEDHFDETIGGKLKEKFPHITFDIQDAGTDHPDSLEELIAAKKTPDIVSVGTIEHLYQLEKYELDYNLDELIEAKGFDLDRIEPALIENARNQDPHNEKGLYAIPDQRPTWSLHYDKDIFDRFGVEYPKDGMTWNEVLELAKTLTREVDGVQYRGLDLDGWYASYLQFDDNPVDPDTDEAIIDQSEAVKRFLEYVDEVVSIPGNYPADEPSSLMHHWGEALSEGNVAMHPNSTDWSYIKDNDSIDIVTYPVWEGHEGKDPLPHRSAIAITEPSEHKEAALDVIEYILSDEIQLENSKQGEPSVLKDDAIHEVFGQDVPELDGKNLESLFINTPATGPEKQSKYSDFVIWKAAVEFMDSNMDINEYIRVLQEEAEESIRSQMESE